MMLKLLAIGTLVLLALSSVMHPRGFRMLLGVLGVGVVTLVAGLIAFSSFAQQMESTHLHGLGRYVAKFYSQLNGQPPWEEAIRETSERALEEFKDDLAPPSRVDLFVHMRPLVFSNTSPSAQQDLIRQIRVNVQDYLDKVKKEHPGNTELQKLAAEDLDIRLLQFAMVKTAGAKKTYVAFDDQFTKHIHIRAKQLTMRQRLIATAYLCLGIGITMCLMFGVLKIINARRRVRPERDYLRLSGVTLH